MQYLEIDFTRQQIAERIGASDDVMSFWLKSGLLVPSRGGAGKGRHRKFDIFQVNIAAVLFEMRRFGVNIAVLREMAALLQRGTELALGAECNFLGLYDALTVHSDLQHYRAGREVEVRTQSWDERFGTRDAVKKPDRLAMSEQDILDSAAFDIHNFHDEVSNITAFAARLKEEDRLPLQLFIDLNQSAYRYVYDGRIGTWGSQEWVVIPLEDGGLRFVFVSGQDAILGKNEDRIRSGLFLAPEAIFAHVWGESVQPILIHELPPSDVQIAHRKRLERVRELQAGGHSAAAIRRIIEESD